MFSRKRSGKNSYWQFLMSERKANPHLSQEELQVHVAKVWRRGGFDSYGRPLEQLLTREAQEQAEKLRMQEEIKDWVEDAARSGQLVHSQFHIIQANVFCLTDEKGVVPAEICIARVSLVNGVEEVFHELIHPGPLPLGYRADCVYNASKTHKIELDMATANKNYPAILEGIVNCLRSGSSGKDLPPVYILPKYRLQTERVLKWLQERSRDKISINLYSLPCLLFHMARVGKEVPDCVHLPTESLAEVQLDRDVFLYTMSMACTWHQQHDETVHCSAAIVRRWAFIFCHICCPRFEVELLTGRHKPSPKTPCSSSRSFSTTSTVSTRDGRREERRKSRKAVSEMWVPNNWGISDPEEKEEERTGDDGDAADVCPLVAHPFFSTSSITVDSMAPSRDSILVIPPYCFPNREEAPSIATTDTDNLVSLADEGQDLSRAAEQFAEDEDYVSTASLISDSTLELPISLVAPEEEDEEEEDWVWEGLSRWSIELSIPQ